MRRPVAAVAAAALAVEAVAGAFVNLVLGLAVRRQSMSLGGLAPGAMSAGAWAAGAALGVFLLLCAVAAARIAAADRPPGRRTRLLLTVCAVAHGVLGTVAVGVAGWPVYTALMVTLGLLVATLVLWPPPAAGPAGAAAPGPANPTGP